jgi:tRNA(fMet)-specific endonuclease VapC
MTTELRVLDTDTLSLLKRGHKQVIERLNVVPLVLRATTVVTAEEHLRGRLAQIGRARNMKQLITAYWQFQDTLLDLTKIQILSFDERATIFFQNLQHLKTRVGTSDLRIAAIALANNGILITANQRHFSQIPGLLTEDWTITTSRE